MTELNPRFTFFLTIFLIFGLFMGYSYYNKWQDGIKQQQFLEQERLRIENETRAKIVLMSTPEPEPTGTPYQMYVPSPYKLGSSLKMNEWFNWKANNVSGLKDMNVSVTMYGYKILKEFSYYDYHWGQRFKEKAPDGYTYFFAYINIVMDDMITGNDTRMFLPQQTEYILYIGDTVYFPTVFDYEHNQILEMDNTFDLGHVDRIKPYAYEYKNKPNETTKVKAPYMEKQYTLYGGVSNSEDGYIIYQIPESFNPRMIRLHGNFFSFGSASWRITD